VVIIPANTPHRFGELQSTPCFIKWLHGDPKFIQTISSRRNETVAPRSCGAAPRTFKTAIVFFVINFLTSPDEQCRFFFARHSRSAARTFSNRLRAGCQSAKEVEIFTSAHSAQFVVPKILLNQLCAPRSRTSSRSSSRSLLFPAKKIVDLANKGSVSRVNLPATDITRFVSNLTKTHKKLASSS